MQKSQLTGQILELKNAADCYYEISKCADISEKDGSTIATFEIKAEEGIGFRNQYQSNRKCRVYDHKETDIREGEWI